ncbi:non-specific lipid-transfer protein 2-like [Andrographis paniculata]|uniref:non-specific lipid-transfer protein 2-like n=1 Tax=Andrographis paniculata TaxID=175694 RepID=UPI0021E98206|nr:non-specific lipid-transfer protein 2-like [Andrographis paniculata]
MKTIIWCSTVVLVCLLAAVAAAAEEEEEVNCSSLEMTVCTATLIARRQALTPECCDKLMEQRPCMCSYKRDPNLRQYFGSSLTRKLTDACGVRMPDC